MVKTQKITCKLVSLLCLLGSVYTVDVEEYDYIIVGAGAAGGTLAASLAERDHNVLLVEAGSLESLQEKECAEIPAFHATTSEEPDISWKFLVEHYSDPNRQNHDSKRCPNVATCDAEEGVFYPRGSTVGGSGSTNAMISVLPHDSDWDNLASLTGDSSWNSDGMREYFKKVERNLYGQDGEDGHGTNGWLDVNHNAIIQDQPNGTFTIPLPIDVTLSYLPLIGGAVSMADTGISDHLSILFPFQDVNKVRTDNEPQGMFQVPVAVSEKGRRSGIRGRILSVMDRGYPLTLKTGVLTTRIIFKENTTKAEGIEVIEAANIYKADWNARDASNYSDSKIYRARKEVILSAGAFNTPQLLMLSGVGPKEELAEVGIETRLDLPGVGKNLMDRYEIPITFEQNYLFTEYPINFPALEDCNFDLANKDDCYFDWKDGQEGIYTQPGAFFSVIKDSTQFDTDLNIVNQSRAADPDLYMFGVGGNFRGYYPRYSDDAYRFKNRFSWLALKGHSKNRGEVKLKSQNPLDTPSINFKYFGDPEAGAALTDEHEQDLLAMLKAVKLMRQAARTSSNLLFFGNYKEVWPGEDVATDQEIKEFIMNETWGHHASCTAKIGADDDVLAVLDGQFRVRGAEGLRVVDASVFPEIPGFFPSVAVYMLAEKAADVIDDSDKFSQTS